MDLDKNEMNKQKIRIKIKVKALPTENQKVCIKINPKVNIDKSSTLIEDVKIEIPKEEQADQIKIKKTNVENNERLKPSKS